MTSLGFCCNDSIVEAKKDNANNLWNTMLPCDKVNLKLNPKKFQFSMNEVTLMGYLVSAVMEVLYPEGTVHCRYYKPEGRTKSEVQQFIDMPAGTTRVRPRSYRNGDATRRQGFTPFPLPFRILT